MKKTKIYAEVLEESALEQFEKAMSLECNVQGALMPDAHSGYTLPIGAVIKSKEMVFPSYVGYDIGCGMCALKINVHKEELDLEMLRDDIVNSIPVGFNRHSEPVEIPLKILQMPMSDEMYNDLVSTGRFQLGTLGGGNHFIELGEADFDPEIDQSGETWIVIHSGSRGLGHKTADRYMKLAASESLDITELEQTFFSSHENLFKYNRERYDIELKKFIEKEKIKSCKNTEGHNGFNIYSELGQRYLKDMNVCLEYALENRKQMISCIVKAITKQVGEVSTGALINRNHNHAEVLEDGFVIHRKGATHAENGMMGVIPGNMKDGSFIVQGLGNEESMNSSSHGAGRVLSRKKAKEILDVNEFNDTMKGIVTNHTVETLDEAPKAYKNIFEVMELQSELVEVKDRCRPYINVKG